MFKNIQKSLLVNHPLLWNTKIVPLLCVMVVIHILFFTIGYVSGGIDFSASENPFGYNFDREVVTFFSVLTSILSMIIWLVFYFKNNSFKSFYPKSRFSLYKEWLIQLAACLLICGFTGSYFYGKDVRARSYFSEEEAIRRCDIIRSASMFTKGSFENDEFSVVDSNGVDVNVRKDYVEFNGRKYSLNSLMNKNIESFTFFSQDNDSIKKKQLKNLLATNQKNAVQRVFSDFLRLSKEHQLTSNVDENKWLELVYNYPDFEEYYIVGNGYEDYQGQFTDYAVVPAAEQKDTLNYTWKVINGQQVAFHKYHVPLNQLKFGYGKVADSYCNPDFDSDFFMVLLYFGIGCSLLIFSFRVTSGRNWLIAVVAMGVFNMFFGLFTVVFRFSMAYQILVLLLYATIIVYFIFVLRRKTEKSISGILLNGLLWLTPVVIPLLYFVIIDCMKFASGYYEATNYMYNETHFPLIYQLERNTDCMVYLNVPFIVVAMLWISLKVKKWKGIAEG